MGRVTLISALLLFGCEVVELPLVPDGSVANPNVRFMTFNVGNPDDEEPSYPLRLRDQVYEDFVAAAIQGWAPDVIALQEVLPPHTCEAFTETDSTRTCFEHAMRDPAVRRLLGDEYSIVCDMNLQVECIGVRVDFGTIRGVDAGGIDLFGAATPALPGPSCDYAAGECNNDLCDAESTVSYIDVDTVDHGPLRIVHMHPNASGFDADGIFYLGTTCRARQTTQGFNFAPDGIPSLMLGDWNFDPDNEALYSAERAIFEMHVGDGRRFTDHGQRDLVGRRITTTFDDPGGFAIDHVISDFARGSCGVLRSPRFDEEVDFTALAPPDGDYSGRIDHRPVLCDLRWD